MMIKRLQSSKMAEQRDADERWTNRMANEDKITTNAVEVLRSDLNKMSAKNG